MSGDASKLAFTLEDVLSADECKRLIEAAEGVGFSPAGIGPPDAHGAQRVCTRIRDSGRLISDDPAFAQLQFRRIRHHLPSIWQGRRLIGLNEQLKFLRYHPGQKFAPHYDGSFVRPGTSNRTCLTVQLYLSMDHVEGGATIFCGAGEGEGKRCEPHAGRALVFQHNILHEGEEVMSGVKYAIRTDVEYSDMSVAAHAQELLGFAGPWSKSGMRRVFLALVSLPLLLSMWRGTHPFEYHWQKPGSPVA